MTKGIDDARIDLTEGSKFRSVFWDKRNSILKEALPWQTRELKPGETYNNYKKDYDDYASEEAGCCLRSVSTGHLVRLFQHSEREELYINDIVATCFGITSDSTNYVCPTCGKIYPTRQIEFEPCECYEWEKKSSDTKSKLFDDMFLKSRVPSNYVPWVDYRRHWYNNTIMDTELMFYRDLIVEV